MSMYLLFICEKSDKKPFPASEEFFDILKFLHTIRTNETRILAYKIIRKNRKKEVSRMYSMNEKNGYVGEGVPFERIRRITGYLVGTTDRFNNAKRAEESDRVKHSVSKE